MEVFSVTGVTTNGMKFKFIVREADLKDGTLENLGEVLQNLYDINKDLDLYNVREISIKREEVPNKSKKIKVSSYVWDHPRELEDLEEGEFRLALEMAVNAMYMFAMNANPSDLMKLAKLQLALHEFLQTADLEEWPLLKYLEETSLP